MTTQRALKPRAVVFLCAFLAGVPFFHWEYGQALPGQAGRVAAIVDMDRGSAANDYRHPDSRKFVQSPITVFPAATVAAVF